ncbi:MAG: TlpA disulfide reductase family protein [Bacteroidota bacterium]
MKRFSLSVITLAFLASCTSTPEGFTINGELTGEIANGTSVFLKTTDSVKRALIEVDTASVENGVFSFTGKADGPQLHYLFIDGVRGNAPVILENGSISFKAQKDSLSFAEITGTPQNDFFMEYIGESRTLAEMSRSMNEEFRKANAPGVKDTAIIQSLQEEYKELQEKAKNFELDFLKNHPDALISTLILDKVVSSKLLTYKEIEELFNSLSPQMQETRPGKRVKKYLEDGKATAEGSVAPDFSGPDPNGGTIALQEVKGKATLIDFWAAWCKPCRIENPNIVAVYEKYKDKGLQVIGVSLDKTKEDWINAIEMDGLLWNHVSNLQYFQDPIAQLYKIDAIPAAFLLDENGVIVAKNLRGAELEAKVAELLN